MLDPKSENAVVGMPTEMLEETKEGAEGVISPRELEILLLAARGLSNDRIASFRPHLLVYNDTAPIAEGALEGVPCRMEVLYSDSMNARLLADGRFEELGDAELGDLLGAVDLAAALAEREGDPGLG